jgi:hypothetical protein
MTKGRDCTLASINNSGDGTVINSTVTGFNGFGYASIQNAWRLTLRNDTVSGNLGSQAILENYEDPDGQTSMTISSCTISVEMMPGERRLLLRP